uniref:Uncharacterized protein n=1 Tax=viral metagenome TaxID=1070528 RepID=A0A6M3JLT8_9ZZZZ
MVSSMDNPELIELAETQLEQFILVAHKSGLNYWQILKLLLAHCVTLQMQADVEFYMKLS